MAFDVAAARKAGYSEAEIADYLASQRKFDAKAARAAGYDDAEIVSHLSAAAPTAPAKPKAQPAIDVDLTANYLPGLKAQQRETTPVDKSFAELGKGPRRRGYAAPRTQRSPEQKAKDDARMAARYKSDTAGSMARAAGRSLGPLAGGIAGAEAGAALLAPMAPFTLGAAPVVGGIVGGLTGGYLGHKAQQSVIDALPDEAVAAMGQNEAQQRADAKAHPYAVFAAENLPGFLVGRPSGKVASTLFGGGLGGALEAGREMTFDGKVDPAMVGEAAAFGALQTKGTRFARGLVGPEDTAIEAEIRKNRPPPGGGRDREADVMAVGELPTPVDVLPESVVGSLATDARKGSPNATTLFLKYADDIAKGTPTVARRSTGKIAPTDARTGLEAESGTKQDIQAAQESVRPEVPLGEASTTIAERLLAQREAERAAGDRLFEEARSKGVATLDRKAPELDEDAGWAKVSPAEAEEFNVGEGAWINRQTGEIKSGVDMADLQKTREPGPEVAASLRDSIKDFALRPSEIEGTLRLLDDFDKLSAVDTSNIYGLRESLGNLERAYAGTADASAAATARRKLDDLVAGYDAEGRFTGDPEVVKANKAAIDYWRQFRQKFDDNTLLGKLSGTEWRGNSRQPTNDPQTAKRLILGALSESGDRVRDLQQLRDHFGADSPEWRSLRQEAIEQLVGPEKDNPGYVKKLADWQRANPKLGELLMGQEGRAVVDDAGAAITEAQGRLGAMEAGADFTGADPKDFAASVSAMTPAAKRDAAVALRQRLRDAITTPQSSLAVLNEVANNPIAKQNMLALLPAGEARGFIRDAGTLINRVRASRAPLGGVQGADEAQSIAVDLVRIGGAAGGHPIYRAAANALLDLLKGKGSPAKRRADAEQLATDLLDPTKTKATLEFVDKMYGQNAAQRLLGVMRQGAAKHLNSSVVTGRLPGAFTAGQDTDKREPAKAAPEAPRTEDRPIEQDMSDEELMNLVGGEGGGDSLADRNNNPGNLRASPWVRKLPGFKGEDASTRADGSPGFAVFETPDAGVEAQKKLLANKYLANGINTPSKIIEKYNPSSDPRNSPKVMRAYKQYVAKRLGIGVSDPVPAERVGELAQAMYEFESGNRAD